ncbi:hypothetical protein DWF00_25765 [Bosea caraganae]|uniref:Uncharacterized protein n=1 Tax=Bosea caraganae TaxID=2763117 RepID=A0A370LAL7_9HYPH|nr:hypothetical protein [Bosea caraganae]RDJ21759.1 hypothetical protein DWF00_25765 [Bosea caraganae]RDJ28210.1 hypothetical protein DWE98_06390 [Bosea caraganae]
MTPFSARSNAMPPPSTNTPAYTIKSRIIHANKVVIPTQRYDLKPPRGLVADDLRMPNFVKPQEMMALLTDTPNYNPSRLAITHGLVKTEFAFVFPAIDEQWRRAAGPQNRITRQFQGGDVFAQATIAVHVLHADRPLEKNKLSEKLFVVIWEHELLHVLDDIEIMRDWLPEKVRDDEWVKKYMTEARELDESSFDHYIRKDKLTPWLRDGFWQEERNRRAAIRDAPARYAELNEAIANIRSRM